MGNLNIDQEIMDGSKSVYDYWQDQMPLNVAEECGELIKAVSKLERAKSKYEREHAAQFFEPIDWLDLDKNTEEVPLAQKVHRQRYDWRQFNFLVSCTCRCI